MAKSKILNNFSDLAPEAKLEAERIWKMRDTLPKINDVTVPILCLYAATWDQLRDLTVSLDELTDEDISNGVYDDVLDRISKQQKLLIAYMKLLGLDTKPVKAAKNKFFDILTKE